MKTAVESAQIRMQIRTTAEQLAERQLLEQSAELQTPLGDPMW